jgi:hypothetical protein
MYADFFIMVAAAMAVLGRRLTLLLLTEVLLVELLVLVQTAAQGVALQMGQAATVGRLMLQAAVAAQADMP